MLRNDALHWARHCARAILAEDDAGHFDPGQPAWHRYDHDFRSGSPGDFLRFCIVASAIMAALVAAVLAGGAAVTAPTSLLPPYFERAHLRAKSAATGREGLMFEFAGSLEPLVNLVFLAVTGFIAWHGIRYRTVDGDGDFVHLLFGCIAAVFFFLVLFQDVLGIARF